MYNIVNIIISFKHVFIFICISTNRVKFSFGLVMFIGLLRIKLF